MKRTTWESLLRIASFPTKGDNGIRRTWFMQFVYDNSHKRKLRHVELVKDRILRMPTLLLPNDFPYYLDRDIFHCVLWYDNRVPIQPLFEIKGQLLNSYLFDICYYQNAEYNSSVRQIPHFQVFLKPKSPGMIRRPIFEHAT